MSILNYINYEYYGLTGYLYSLICFFVPNIIWQIINIHNINDKTKIKKYIIFTYVYMFYCYCSVEVFAEMGTFWNFMKYREIKGEIYLVPFYVTELTSHILNIIMFIPLGFLIPLIWKRYRKISKVAIIGFLMSFTIEFCQLFCYRTTDINDLITNTLGTVVGFIIWSIFNKIFSCSEENLEVSRYDPIMYIYLGMLGIFCFFMF